MLKSFLNAASLPLTFVISITCSLDILFAGHNDCRNTVDGGPGAGVPLRRGHLPDLPRPRPDQQGEGGEVLDPAGEPREGEQRDHQLEAGQESGERRIQGIHH